MSYAPWTCYSLTRVLNFSFTHGKKLHVIAFCASVALQNDKNSSNKEAGRSCRLGGTEICCSAFFVESWVDFFVSLNVPCIVGNKTPSLKKITLNTTKTLNVWKFTGGDWWSLFLEACPSLTSGWSVSCLTRALRPVAQLNPLCEFDMWRKN